MLAPFSFSCVCVSGGAEMPDALEIIFQTAIAAGKDGAVCTHISYYFILVLAFKLVSKYLMSQESS